MAGEPCPPCHSLAASLLSKPARTEMMPVSRFGITKITFWHQNDQGNASSSCLSYTRLQMTETSFNLCTRPISEAQQQQQQQQQPGMPGGPRMPFRHPLPPGVRPGLNPGMRFPQQQQMLPPGAAPPQQQQQFMQQPGQVNSLSSLFEPN